METKKPNQKLLDFRKKHNLSYEKAGDFFDMSVSTYWRIENMPGFKLSLKDARKIKAKTGFTDDDLLRD